MSFQIEYDDKSLAGASLIEETVKEIQQAFLREKKANKLTQQGLANRLDIKNRSVVNRWLRGGENLSLKTIGELAWALNKTAIIRFEDNQGGNYFDRNPHIVADADVAKIQAPKNGVGAWGSHKSKYTAGTPVLEHA